MILTSQVPGPSLFINARAPASNQQEIDTKSTSVQYEH